MSTHCRDLTSKHSNWISWFNSRISADVINKSNQELFFSTFDLSKGDDACLDNLLSYQETAFLHKVDLGERRVAIFHHLVSAGGNLYDSGEKDYGFLQGVGKSTTTVMTPDIEKLKSVQSETGVAVPTMTNLFDCSTLDAIDALTVGSRAAYRARNFVLIPPFLLEKVHQAISVSNGDAKVVLLNTLESIKEFDIAHSEDDSYADKAKTKCLDFVHWLYLVVVGSASVTGL